MFSAAYKCWAVLLSFCLAAFPLYAEVHDTVTTAVGTATSPVKQNASIEKAPTQEPDPNAEPAINTTDSEPAPALNNSTASQVSPPLQPDTGLQEPDRASALKDYLQGTKDGKRDSKGKPLWILAGLSGTGLCICFGAAGIGIALAVPYYPPPPAEMLIGKSSKYIEGYYEGYTASIRWKNAAWALLGCAIAVAVDIALNWQISFGNFYVNME